MYGEGAVLTGPKFEQQTFREVDEVIDANVVESLLDTYQQIQAIERAFGTFKPNAEMLQDLGLTELSDEHARLTEHADKIQSYCDEHDLVAEQYLLNEEAA